MKKLQNLYEAQKLRDDDEIAPDYALRTLGQRTYGIPDEQVEAADLCVEIPMVGRGASST